MQMTGGLDNIYEHNLEESGARKQDMNEKGHILLQGSKYFFFTGANFEKKDPINQFTGAILGFLGAI